MRIPDPTCPSAFAGGLVSAAAQDCALEFRSRATGGAHIHWVRTMANATTAPIMGAGLLQDRGPRHVYAPPEQILRNHVMQGPIQSQILFQIRPTGNDQIAGNVSSPQWQPITQRVVEVLSGVFVPYGWMLYFENTITVFSGALYVWMKWSEFPDPLT